MFEEDFERCFICQAPSKGLYCSQECRLQDKGSASPNTKSNGLAPVRLTAQLPASLSPAVRPTHTITPSPIFGRPRGTSTSSSSLSESPIQSPHTLPSGGDSPQKEAFNLPPPAYPGYVGSVPMKIPSGLQNRVTSNGSGNGHTNGTTTPTGSVDTLRFGRKSSVTNSVTSPLALAPRCGCGRALGHRNRSLPGDELNFACLNVGPGGAPDADVNVLRLVSDPIHRTPNLACPPLPEDRSISHVLGSSLLLSRSRSDPHHPPSPRTARPHGNESAKTGGSIHPRPALEVSLGATPPERAQLPSVAPLRGVRSRSAAPSAQSRREHAPAAEDSRGRSRERVERIEVNPELVPQLGMYHEEREVAPTRVGRSRGRDMSRSGEREGRSRSRPMRDAVYPAPMRGRTAGIAA
ncbi:hypothetical protein CC85DRAFT_11457 [Cutaneotrichosporon oleaginosum]|uniref:Uncharacterized protein n=1 Tax=Cutaneotrichosporon oleaginosum TaxID=879819 RepID=A0A0J0XCY6_9TREE|nr:uncharacterized protein CC85DRAFT_11457 [Cutaneotrichosporon oleaginosum]KLT38925.1 hypothetical protein CC85DRAFT_11457 [Cutaneotrichosporon oleaginosum]TXT14711.1 hypothetical protein COLE_00904 [Cutaneotrichosporon oleaginosum]